MRTTLDLDDELMDRAWNLTKPKSKKELVERSLEALIREQSARRMIARLGRFPLRLTPKQLDRLRREE